MFSQIGTVS